MKNILSCFCIYAFSAAVAYSQIPASPRPVIEVRSVTEQRTYNQQIDLQRKEKLQSDNFRPFNNSYGFFVNNYTQPLYRNSTGEELKNIAPKPEDSTKFSTFLRQPDTGLIKLVADNGCSENPLIVVATPQCLAHTMPGAGASYSFRTKDYRFSRLADIMLTENSLRIPGVNQQGFFAELGDIPLDQVDLQTKGVAFAADFKPEPNAEKIKNIDLQLDKGISDDNFIYRRSAELKDNTTYILRSIAYRGSSPQVIRGFKYNELDFDKRKDVLIAFRVVRLENGSATLLWKQLASRKSPKTASPAKK